jgi:hypothetical protein
MRDKGLKPVAVIHNFYNHEIAYYLENFECPWLALGSDQSHSFADVEYAVNKIKKLSPDTKIHLFGKCNYEWFLKLPIDACDITSAQIVAKYGYILYWNEANEKVNKTDKIYIGGRMKEFKENEYHFTTYPFKSELEKYLHDTFGLAFGDLLGYATALNFYLINIRYYTDLQKRINEHRSKTEPVPEKEAVIEKE